MAVHALKVPLMLDVLKRIFGHSFYRAESRVPGRLDDRNASENVGYSGGDSSLQEPPSATLGKQV